MWHVDMPMEYRDAIVTGDAKELAKRIPDESIDLIFSDPVYDHMEDYAWLAETAARVLKPNSAALVWIANPRIFEVGAAMSNHLRFVLPLNYTVPGGTYMLFSRKVFSWSTVCLWYEKGKSATRKAIPDSVISTQQTANGFKWNKNPEAMAKWLDAFTTPGAIVYDPFTGGGTVPAVCKMLGRHYIASEIDPGTAERARQRVRDTQPPLLVVEPEQLRMAV